MTTKKTKADPLVAASTILIDGKAFEAGERVTGVPKDEVDRAVSVRRVVRQSVFDTLAAGVPAPEFVSDEPEADDDAGDDDAGEGEGEGDAGEGEGQGDNGGSDQ